MIHIAHSAIYSHPLPEGHRFPMLKYELIPEQLMHEGMITQKNIFTPVICPKETVLLTHTEEYYNKLIHQTLTASEQRKIGFPQSPLLTKRELVIAQGTIDCCYHALKNGAALNVAGGTHHAYADKGEGFCLLNDMAIAANYLLHKREVEKIIIIDLDVHQGNGSAKIFEHEPSVFTFSMHGAHNYPFHKEKSDLDVPLLDGTDTNTYLSVLQNTLPALLDKEKPQFAFFLSGVDILDTDKFGKLKVTMEGCRQRDVFVFEELKKRKIPVTVAMGGGYSADVRKIVEAHCNTFKAAINIFS
jgi:acetoin utilization deacetylase AcuC-like enzyme